ncbi:MAG: hypothetical protein RR500_01650 [Bacilli bacterium]
MKAIVTKIVGFSVEWIWFGLSTNNHNVDMKRYLRVTEGNISNFAGNSVKVKTLISDLSCGTEQMFSKIRKNVRYEIRKSDNLAPEINYYESCDLTSNFLEECGDFYNQFCDNLGNKNLKKAFRINQLELWRKNNLLVISECIMSDGRIVHIYAIDSKHCCLLFSFSNVHNENSDKNKIGIANKRLHWEDMLFFKNKGVESMDWGNVSSFTKPNGIDDFKKSFGGDNKIVYNGIEGVNFKGKLIALLIKIMQLDN